MAWFRKSYKHLGSNFLLVLVKCLLQTALSAQKWGLKCLHWCFSQWLSVLLIILETFWTVSLTLCISKHFRSGNNAISLVNSGTSSMGGTKRNKGYRINCREDYLSLTFSGSVYLSLTCTVCWIALAPLFDGQKCTDKSNPSNRTRRNPGCSALWGSAFLRCRHCWGASCDTCRLEEAGITASRWVKSL